MTSLTVTLLVFGAKQAHWLEGLESRWLNMMSFLDRAEFNAPVIVVSITDGDFQSPELFQGISPLDPGVLDRLVRAVSAHGPQTAVLDVEIHPSSNEPTDQVQRRLRLYHTLDSLSRNQNTVWVLVRNYEAEARQHIPPREERAAWEALVSSPRIRWADPRIERKHDLVTWVPFRYAHDPVSTRHATVLGAVATLAGRAPVTDPIQEAEGGLPRIRYSGIFIEETSNLSSNQVSASLLLSHPRREGEHSLLENKIVLIGGTYWESRDFHPTPIGDMAGVHVWAEAIASWLRADALREPPVAVTLALESLVGMLVGLILVRSGPAWGLLYCLLAVLPLTVAFTILTFGTKLLFINFIPTCVCVYLHYQVELHFEISHLRRALKAQPR